MNKEGTTMSEVTKISSNHQNHIGRFLLVRRIIESKRGPMAGKS